MKRSQFIETLLAVPAALFVGVKIKKSPVVESPKRTVTVYNVFSDESLEEVRFTKLDIFSGSRFYPPGMPQGGELHARSINEATKFAV